MTKILIAEDNELNLKLMQDVLESKNYEVFVAKDGEEALEKIKENSYELLLLDLQMPKVSGFEVLQELKNRSLKIKTIVVSACAMEGEISKAKNLGCEAFITKPIRIKEFLESVEKSLKP